MKRCPQKGKSNSYGGEDFETIEFQQVRMQKMSTWAGNFPYIVHSRVKAYDYGQSYVDLNRNIYHSPNLTGDLYKDGSLGDPLYKSLEVRLASSAIEITVSTSIDKLLVVSHGVGDRTRAILAASAQLPREPMRRSARQRESSHS